MRSIRVFRFPCRCRTWLPSMCHARPAAPLKGVVLVSTVHFRTQSLRKFSLWMMWKSARCDLHFLERLAVSDLHEINAEILPNFRFPTRSFWALGTEPPGTFDICISYDVRSA